MLDTNVLISALLFPGSKMDTLMNCIFTRHQLVLSSYVVEELKNVVKRKFPNKEHVINKLLVAMSYEFVYTPIIEDVDILITGDKDFNDIDIEKPEIMTPTEFIEFYL